MKRLSLLGCIGVMAAFLAGCPIYDDNDGDEDCRTEDCTDPDVPGCTSSADCATNETCGSDNQCHTGDCTFPEIGCPSGSTCVIGEDMTASCQPGTSGTGGSGAGGSGSGGSGNGGSGNGGAGGGPVVIWCGNPDDCEAGETCGPKGTCEPGACDVVGCIFGYSCAADGTCQPNNPAACGTDSDCSGLGQGWLCINGTCTAPADQCSDQSQCEVAGSKCVDGTCTPSCTSDAQCDAGYACDETLGICTVILKPCAITNDCGGPDSVCVDGACVPRSDPMGTCPPDHVWVENGCIPSQAANFNCTTDGVQDKCASGSICLHHNCYISCAAPNADACVNQPSPSLKICKSVTTSSGDHQVCGSNDTLGNECDPTAGISCAAGKICIDGFCK